VLRPGHGFLSQGRSEATPEAGFLSTGQVAMLSRFLGSALTKNLWMLMGGAVVAQGLGLLATPVLARMYLPAHFGQLGFYVSILGFLCPVSMLRYEMAIPGCQDDRQASRVYALALLTGLAVSLLSGLALMVPALTAALRRAGCDFGFWVIPLGVMGTAAYSASSYWAVRKGDFKGLAQTKGTQGLGMVATQVLAGWLGWRPEGLLVGQLLGQSSGLGRLLRRMWQQDRHAFQGLSAAEIGQVAREFSRFPRFSVAAVLLESFTLYMPLMVLAYRFGPVVAGWVTLVQMTFWKPAGMLAVNLSQINFHDFAALKWGNPRALWARYTHRSFNFILLATACALGLALLGHGVIRFLFSAEWQPAIFCLWVSLPMVFFPVAVSPFGTVMEVFERQDLHLVRELTRAGLMLSALIYVLAAGPGWKWALVALNLGTLLGYSYYFWACRRVVSLFCRGRLEEQARLAPPPLFLHHARGAVAPLPAPFPGR